jgi:DNA-binding transcriptional LysR family regulator
VQSAEDDVTGFRTAARGTLRIAASTTIARYIVPGLLHEFLRRHPDVPVRLESMHSRFVTRLLLEREVDVALVEAVVRHPRIRVTPWLVDRTVVVAGASHPLARRTRVPVTALAGQLLVVREPGSGAQAVADAALRERGVDLKRRIVIDCHEAIKHLLMHGTGIAIMPERAVTEQVRHGTLRILPVENWDVRRSFSRLTLLGRRASAVGRAFEAILDAPPRLPAAS